jgi:hypothetical protein
LNANTPSHKAHTFGARFSPNFVVFSTFASTVNAYSATYDLIHCFHGFFEDFMRFSWIVDNLWVLDGRQHFGNAPDWKGGT